MVKSATPSTETDHEVRLVGAWSARSDGAPSILARRDDDFIAAMLQELAAENAAAVVPAHRPPTEPDGALRLFQPLHRTFHLTLLEAFCDSFGRPRLDPRKIESAGLVVRRVQRQTDGTRRFEAWSSHQHAVLGWVPLPDASSPLHLRDPDPKRRRRPRFTTDPEFDRARFGAGETIAEETAPLFVAPPATAAATCRTLLYGLVPLTSTSRAGAMARGPAPDRDAWNAHLSLLLRPSAHPVDFWPAATETQRLAKLDRSDVNQPSSADSSTHAPALRLGFLARQLGQEFSLLRPVNPETCGRLRAALNRLTVTLVSGETRPAGEYLTDVIRFYFDQPAPDLQVPRLRTWPAVDETRAAEILQLLQQIATETELSVFHSSTGAARFDDPSARYVLRAFLRVRQTNGCPPRLVWSPYSEEFAIAPWYESGPAGPATIPLPDLTPAFLRAARPNVAFAVPSRLANVLNQDPKRFLDGSAGQGPALSLDWLCGFNLPVITVCAFVVLNVFLSLLNLVFFWLPFVKICVPFPRKK